MYRSVCICLLTYDAQASVDNTSEMTFIGGCYGHFGPIYWNNWSKMISPLWSFTVS